MPYIIIHHRVKNFDIWKPFFEKHGDLRKANGSKGGTVYRSINDHNEIITILHWENLDKARSFAQSDDLRKVMEQAGVIGKPDIYFLEEVEKITG
jgi:heme-degrading monooxygenase HmoA